MIILLSSCCSDCNTPIELSRTTEKLTQVEAQVHGLEERRTAAETQLQRAQGELKAATDLVNSTKKHAAVLQDTLNVRLIVMFLCYHRQFVLYSTLLLVLYNIILIIILMSYMY